MESLLSSPSDTIRNSAEAMAELHECLVGMARRESVLRTQLEEASAEHAIALSRATDLTSREASASAAATSATEKVAAGLGTSAAQMRADLGAELGSQLREGLAQGLAQAQQGVLHLQSDLQSAREERERHDAELVALRSQHRAQMDSMRSTLEQAMSELRRRMRGRIEAWRALAVLRQSEDVPRFGEAVCRPVPTPTQAQGRGARHAARRAGRGDSAPCTMHHAPCTMHTALCTVHPAPCTLHCKPYTLAGARRAPRGRGRALRRSAAAAAAGHRLRTPCTLRTATAPPPHRLCMASAWPLQASAPTPRHPP